MNRLDVVAAILNLIVTIISMIILFNLNLGVLPLLCIFGICYGVAATYYLWVNRKKGE